MTIREKLKQMANEIRDINAMLTDPNTDEDAWMRTISHMLEDAAGWNEAPAIDKEIE